MKIHQKHFEAAESETFVTYFCENDFNNKKKSQINNAVSPKKVKYAASAESVSTRCFFYVSAVTNRGNSGSYRFSLHNHMG